MSACLRNAYYRFGADGFKTGIVAIDLTQSESVRGPDGKSEFQKNIEAVTELLARVPANSHVTIIGITDHSFTQPDILLTAVIPTDAGYFGERLNAARTELVRAWRNKISKLSPEFRRTDISGALALAAQIFSRYPATQRKLLIYSDMRNSTPELNLEEGITLPKRSWQGGIAIADLHNVTVWVLGTATSNATTASWERLRNYWIEYFSRTGASVALYSPLWDE